MPTIEFIIWIILLLGILFIAYLYVLSIVNSIIYKVPQVASFNSDLRVMRKWLVKYNLKWKKLIDMWSGTGKMLRFFEREFGCNTTGYEIDLANSLIARIFNKIFKLNATIIRWNYFTTNLWDFDIVYIYLYPELVAKIEEKLEQEARPGTIVIANAFKLIKATPKEIIYDDKWKEEVYIYEF
jgi:hypothetical protein